MKRILVLSMMLVLGFTSLSAVSYAQSEDANRTVNPGNDPADNAGRTYVKTGTEGGAGVVGLQDDCPICAARRSGVAIKKATNPGATSSPNSPADKAQGGTQ